MKRILTKFIFQHIHEKHKVVDTVNTVYHISTDLTGNVIVLLTSLNCTSPSCSNSLMQLWADSVWENSPTRHVFTPKKGIHVLVKLVLIGDFFGDPETSGVWQWLDCGCIVICGNTHQCVFWTAARTWNGKSGCVIRINNTTDVVVSNTTWHAAPLQCKDWENHRDAIWAM